MGRIQTIQGMEKWRARGATVLKICKTIIRWNKKGVFMKKSGTFEKMYHDTGP